MRFGTNALYDNNIVLFLRNEIGTLKTTFKYEHKKF